MIKRARQMIVMEALDDALLDKLFVKSIRLVGSDGAKVVMTDKDGNNKIEFAGDDTIYFESWFDGLKFNEIPAGTVYVNYA